MKPSALISLTIVVLVACQGSELLDAPPNDPGTLQFIISDAAHGGSVPGFYFLPPMVPSPSVSGTFDGSLSPVVEICELDATATCAASQPADFPIVFTTSGSGSERIRVDMTDESYITNWHTGRFALDDEKLYRISVSAEGRELGFADVDVARSGKDANDIDTDQYVPLRNGRTLPIKFRIETGIAGAVVVAPADPTIKDNETQAFTVTVTDLHGDPLPDVGVSWTIDDETIATVAPVSGTTDPSGQATTTATPAGTLGTTIVRAASEGLEDNTSLTVESSAAPPSATDDSYGMGVNTTLTVAAGAGPPDGLLVNDDLGVPAATLTSFGGGSSGGIVTDNVAGGSVALAGGTLTVNADGSFAIVNPTTTGSFTFDYQITNASGTSDATVTIQVSVSPTANADDYSTGPSTTLNVGAPGGLLANDDLGAPPAVLTSFGGGSLGGAVTDNAVAATVSLAGGSLTVNADGSFDLVTPTEAGTHTFDYRLTNAAGTSDATVTIRVGTAPTATADSYDMLVGATLTVGAGAGPPDGLLVNDDLGAPPAALTSFGAGSLGGAVTDNATGSTVTIAGGSLTVNADGSFDLVSPTSDGTFTFDYRLTNTLGTSDATVTILITVPDAAPTVVSTTPADGATGVLPTAIITIDFSEDVNATASSFTIECPAPGNPQSFSLSGLPSASFTLTPDANLPAGTICTVTVIAAQVTDADANDPPDNMAADFVFTFTLPVDAVDDAYPATVVGNVSVNSANVSGGAFSVTDNDVSNSPLTITAFDATSANGGTVGMTTAGANIGEFTYDPPPGFEGVDTFTYTISDGSTTDIGTVELTVTDMIWFVDNAAAAGDGRLSSPFNSLAAFDAANGAGGTVPDPKDGDVIFLYESSSAYTGGVTLRGDQQLIGQDATSSLSTLSGIVLPTSAAVLPSMNSGNATIVEITSSADGVALGTNNDVHGLTIGNTAGAGLSGSTFGTLTVADVSIDGSGQMLDLANGSVAATFEVLSSVSSVAEGVSLNDVTGLVSHTGTSSIVGSATEAVRITTSPVAFVYNGDITNNGDGIELTGNAGATIDFGGTLTLNTPAGLAFTAVEGGQVTATGSGNTISSVGAGALAIINTTIGSGGVTFESISASGGSYGIRLINAGSGGLTVTGTGFVDGSGGIIQNKTTRGVEIIDTDNVSLNNVALTNAATTNGANPLNSFSSCSGVSNSGCNAAVYLSSVTNVTLANVDITTTAQQGINGLNVVDFTLTGSTITGAGDQVHEGGVRMFNLAGTVNLADNVVEFSSERNVYVFNDFPGATTLTMTVISNSFHDTQSSGFGGDGLEIELTGTSRLDVDVNGNSFLRNRTNGLQIAANGSAVVASADITDNDFDPGTGIGKGIDLAANGNAQLTFNISGNPTIYSDGGTAVGVRGFVDAQVAGRIINNPDVQTDRTAGGAAGGSGISVGAEERADVVVEIANNGISNVFQDIGIQVFSRGGLGGSPGRVDATISSNTVALQAGSAFPLYGVEVRAQDNNTVCANVSNNSVTLGNGTAAFRQRTTNTGSTVLLQGFTADATTTWDNNGNTPAGSVSSNNNGTLAGGTCALPSNPLP